MQHGLHPQFQNIQIQAQGTLPQTILNESIIKRTGEPGIFKEFYITFWYHC